MYHRYICLTCIVPSFMRVYRPSLFRQLCILYWLLDTMNADPQIVVRPIASCWNVKYDYDFCHWVGLIKILRKMNGEWCFASFTFFPFRHRAEIQCKWCDDRKRVIGSFNHPNQVLFVIEDLVILCWGIFCKIDAPLLLCYTRVCTLVLTACSCLPMTWVFGSALSVICLVSVTV